MAAKPKTKPRPAIEPEPTRPQLSSASAVTGRSLLSAKLGLELLVFVAGAVLMGLEIVGSRILAPYFGNSVFVWGSLISLFLIALSLGYYFGGRLSDRQPFRALLNSIVLAVAAWMFVVAAIGAPVCDAILAQGFGEKAGPFLASIVLFLLPSVGMGMVSPFAVRLATHTVASVGKTAGTLYALSTLGSIAGTVLTTFVLIPSFGAGAILKGLAVALMLVALATFPFANLGSAVRITGIAVLAAALGIFGISQSRASLPLGSILVLDADTPYHHISVVDRTAQVEMREMRFDSYVESSIELAPPHRSLSRYTKYFHLAFLPRPEIRRALFIGAGGGVGPRAFHMHDPAMEIDVVDIDAKVLEIARTHFFMDDVPQIKPVADDGRLFVRKQPPGRYDAIILDAFSIGGRIPFHLVTREFFTLCREKLTPGGVFVMNINSSQRGPNSQIYRSMYKTIGAAFPRTYAFAVGSQVFPPEQSTNVIFVAVNGEEEISRDEWSRLADQYESRSYVKADDVTLMIDDLVVAPPNLDEAALFTDDYAPIETMPF